MDHDIGVAEMGGLTNGINFNLLFSPPATDSSAGILNALFNPAPATNFASTGQPLLDLKLAQKNETADVALEAKQPVVSQTVAAFLAAVKQAKDIKSALANPTIQKVLLTASGLSNYIGETALVQKAFMSDPSDPKSAVNQLGDGTLLSTVQTYNFAKNGLAELQNPKILSTLTNGYAEVKWRQSLNQATPGLSNALAFLSSASSIKSVGDVLASPVNFYVVTGALGIPPNIVFQSVAAQKTALNSRIDYAKFQDPKFVQNLTNRYLISQQGSNQSGPPDLMSLAVQSTGLVV